MRAPKYRLNVYLKELMGGSKSKDVASWLRVSASYISKMRVDMVPAHQILHRFCSSFRLDARQTSIIFALREEATQARRAERARHLIKKYAGSENIAREVLPINLSLQGGIGLQNFAMSGSFNLHDENGRTFVMEINLDKTLQVRLRETGW